MYGTSVLFFAAKGSLKYIWWLMIIFPISASGFIKLIYCELRFQFLENKRKEKSISLSYPEVEERKAS
jgi:hypothetical protein